MHSYLICYDIEDNRERSRVARVLEGYGQRVQYSVFEVHLRPADVGRLREELQTVLGEQGHDVRFYRLTADGLKSSSALDGSPIGRRELVVIV